MSTHIPSIIRSTLDKLLFRYLLCDQMLPLPRGNNNDFLFTVARWFSIHAANETKVASIQISLYVTYYSTEQGI